MKGIILAGGSGSRMGAQRNKVLLDVQGKPVIVRAVEAFVGLVDGIILVSRTEDIPDMQAAVDAAQLTVTYEAASEEDLDSKAHFVLTRILGNWDDKIQLDDLTIEDCEKLYQSGYEVIIDNGRVVDLRKFK